MAKVDVSFTPLPSHVRTARLIALAVARRMGMPEETLDEVRLAVGEACSRAVGVHAVHAPEVAISMRLAVEPECFTVEVTDVGPLEDDPRDAVFDSLDATPDASDWGSDSADAIPAGFGLVVIGGLVDEVVVTSDDAGTHVRMAWPTRPAETSESD